MTEQVSTANPNSGATDLETAFIRSRQALLDVALRRAIEIFALIWAIGIILSPIMAGVALCMAWGR